MPSQFSPVQVLTQGADAAYLSRRPLPNAPDGLYDWQARPDATLRPEAHSGVTNLINKVESIKRKGIDVPPRAISAFFDEAIHPDAVDDRKGAFADGLELLAKLPSDSPVQNDMSDSAVAMLYNSLPHPPASYLGPVHTFRQADGGGNNLQDYDLGRAGTPYSRSVQGKWCSAPKSLPDPDLVFEALLKRRAYKPHPNGNSSMTFAFASLVTHSLFRTNPRDWNINDTSSYLDISPVYGINQDAQDLVRDKDQGRGYLYPDTFSEERLLFLPPASSVLLIILARNHNFIADMLLKLNENGKWQDPPPTDPDARKKQDEEIFQTARLVNGGHFMSLIMGDYVPGFLGLSEGYFWNMNAFDPIKTKTGATAERGQGNHCSVEFNVLYRWHTTISQADEKWTEDLFGKTFSKPTDQLTIPDFLGAFVSTIQSLPEPKSRTFAGLQRGPDGKFYDDDLARILHDATEHPANSYGARNTPACLKIIEIMGMLQARAWGVCSMNEFRKFLGLKQFESFEEWNPDPEIANTARQLYGHIDDLELYTGLQCEELMPLTPGSRFACGYTMTRAILGDAISLVRGDRFYTTSFTPGNLTTWGYQDTMRDPNNGGFGGNLPKLLTRHLPRHYPYNSVYSCFPFFTPAKMKDSLTKLKLVDQYTFTRPVAAPIPKTLNTLTGIRYVFTDPKRFPMIYEMGNLGGGYGFMLCFDDAGRHDPDRALALHSLFPSQDSVTKYLQWYKDGISKRIAERSLTYDGVPGRYVDIVKEVINVTAVHWAADILAGIDLKTKENPRGLFTEQELYDMIAIMFTLWFYSVGDNEHLFSLNQMASQASAVLEQLVTKSVQEVAPLPAGNPLASFASRVSGFFFPVSNKPSYPFISRLAATGRPHNEIIAMVVGLVGASAVTTAQAAVNVVDFYLQDAHATEFAQILQLVQKDDAQSTETLRAYVREGLRLRPQFPGLFRRAAVDATVPQGWGAAGTKLPDLEVKAGDILFASLKNAHTNPLDYPDPTSVKTDRPKSGYSTLFGTGFHGCPGLSVAEQIITEIVRTVFNLKNVRRAGGSAGQLNNIPMPMRGLGTITDMFQTPFGTITPWPESMWLVYDP